MKIIILLISCLSCLSLNGQDKDLKLIKVHINSGDKNSIKGYLFEVDEDKIVLVPKRKWVNKFLISENCETCHTISRDSIWDLKYSQKKPFRPIGLMVSGGLGLIAIAAADNTPNPDGLNNKDLAGLYATLGIAIGGVVDLIRLIGHSKGKNKVDINRGLSDVLLPKSAVYQFNKIREQQLAELSVILTQIENEKTRHRKPINIYRKDKKMLSGYIIGQKDGQLLLGLEHLNKKAVLKYRNNPPKHLQEISLEDIFYYDFGKR